MGEDTMTSESFVATSLCHIMDLGENESFRAAMHVKALDIILDRDKAAKLGRKWDMRTCWGKQEIEGKV